MNTRLDVAPRRGRGWPHRLLTACLLGAGLLAAAGAETTAAPAPGPSLRTTSTPAGLMLTLDDPHVVPAADHKAASTPALATATIEGRQVRVLREPAAPSALARSVAAPAAAPPELQAHAMPNGSQMLVLPSAAAAPAPAPAQALLIVDIDPARPGTRVGDPLQPGTLYRKPAAAAKNTR